MHLLTSEKAADREIAPIQTDRTPDQPGTNTWKLLVPLDLIEAEGLECRLRGCIFETLAVSELNAARSVTRIAGRAFIFYAVTLNV